jgi:hypothetical protein
MANRSISIEIYTASHRVLGRIHPSASGLFSYLNMPTSSFIEIEGAHWPGTSIGQRSIQFPQHAHILLYRD